MRKDWSTRERAAYAVLVKRYARGVLSVILAIEAEGEDATTSFVRVIKTSDAN